MSDLEFRQVVVVEDLLRAAYDLCADGPLDIEQSEYVRGIVEAIADSCVRATSGSAFMDETKWFVAADFERRKAAGLRHWQPARRVVCRHCDLGGCQATDGTYHGDRDVEPCPRSSDDFHHWIPKEGVYQTIFVVEVFSEGPYEVRDDDNLSDLAAIDYDITQGDHIGNVEQVEQRVVPTDAIDSHMLRIGNDGTFFEDADKDTHLADVEDHPVELVLRHLHIGHGIDPNTVEPGDEVSRHEQEHPK